MLFNIKVYPEHSKLKKLKNFFYERMCTKELNPEGNIYTVNTINRTSNIQLLLNECDCHCNFLKPGSCFNSAVACNFDLCYMNT